MKTKSRPSAGLMKPRPRRDVRPPRGTRPGLVANARGFIPRSIATASGVCGVRQSDGKYAKGCGAPLVDGECPTCAADKVPARSHTGASLADRAAVQVTGVEQTTHPLDGKVNLIHQRKVATDEDLARAKARFRAKPKDKCATPKKDIDGVRDLDRALAYLKRAPEAGARIAPPVVERAKPRDTGTPVDAAMFARPSGNVAIF